MLLTFGIYYKETLEGGNEFNSVLLGYVLFGTLQSICGEGVWFE